MHCVWKPQCYGAAAYAHNNQTDLLAAARKLTASREMLLWMTPSEAPIALQASECSELLDPMRASCGSSRNTSRVISLSFHGHLAPTPLPRLSRWWLRDCAVLQYSLLMRRRCCTSRLHAGPANLLGGSHSSCWDAAHTRQPFYKRRKIGAL